MQPAASRAGHRARRFHDVTHNRVWSARRPTLFKQIKMVKTLGVLQRDAANGDLGFLKGLYPVFHFFNHGFTQNYTEHFDEWILFLQGQCRTRINTDKFKPPGGGTEC